MQFGTIKTIRTLDEDGSVESVVEHYKYGEVVGQVRKVFVERHRVTNELEEAAEYHKFAKRYHDDPTMLDVGFWLDGKHNPKPYYYVVCTYTQIQH